MNGQAGIRFQSSEASADRLLENSKERSSTSPRKYRQPGIKYGICCTKFAHKYVAERVGVEKRREQREQCARKPNKSRIDLLSEI
jgi:hypothetical protein